MSFQLIDLTSVSHTQVNPPRSPFPYETNHNPLYTTNHYPYSTTIQHQYHPHHGYQMVDPFQLEPVYVHTQSGVKQEKESKMNKKCSRCSLYYTDADDVNDRCWYHPGAFKQVYKSSYLSVTAGLWSCCGSESNEKGCTAMEHVEDVEMTSIMNMFSAPNESVQDLYPDLCQDSLDIFDNQKEDAPVSETDTVKKTIATNSRVDTDCEDTEYVKHYVSQSDSLQGIALLYGVSVKSIKRLNRIVRDAELYSFNNITIPVKSDQILVVIDAEDQEERRVKKATARFLKEFKTQKEVAKYYLSLYENDFELARKEYMEDFQWEKNNPFSSSNTN